jgi:hypothetical protein
MHVRRTLAAVATAMATTTVPAALTVTAAVAGGAQPAAASASAASHSSRLPAMLARPIVLKARPVAVRKATSGGSKLVFGSQFHGMWSSYSDGRRKHVLSELASHGVRSVRIDVSWAMLQPSGPHSYDPWGVGFVNRVITMAVNHGLQPLVTLFMTPDWANGGAGPSTLPTNPADFARVAKWAAHHWAGKVFAWEVWNEPNAESFDTGTDPAAYAALLRAAYPAFHAGDPKTKVVFGGPSYVDVDWVHQVLNHGALHSFDVMAVHPYMGVANLPPTTADDGTEWTMRHVSAMHNLLVGLGRPHTPIWFTEFGWSIAPTVPGAPNWLRGVGRHTQARYLAETIRMVRRDFPYVTHLYWYDDLRGIEGGFNGGYGLVRADGAPTLALRAVPAAMAS